MPECVDGIPDLVGSGAAVVVGGTVVVTGGLAGVSDESWPGSGTVSMSAGSAATAVGSDCANSTPKPTVNAVPAAAVHTVTSRARR